MRSLLHCRLEMELGAMAPKLIQARTTPISELIVHLLRDGGDCGARRRLGAFVPLAPYAQGGVPRSATASLTNGPRAVGGH